MLNTLVGKEFKDFEFKSIPCNESQWILFLTFGNDTINLFYTGTDVEVDETRVYLSETLGQKLTKIESNATVGLRFYFETKFIGWTVFSNFDSDKQKCEEAWAAYYRGETFSTPMYANAN